MRLNNALSESYSFFCAVGRGVSTAFGIAIIGIAINSCLIVGNRLYSWIISCKGTTKDTVNVANSVLSGVEENKPSKRMEPEPQGPSNAPIPVEDQRAKALAAAGTEQEAVPISAEMEEQLKNVVQDTEPFSGYKVNVKGVESAVLTGMTVRPSDLLLDELLKGTSYDETKPGSGKMFAFIDKKEYSKKPSAAYEIERKIGQYLRDKAKNDPDGKISVTAQGKTGDCYDSPSALPAKEKIPLDTVYGDKVFEISNKEIGEVIDSQEIYTSAFLPLKFYKELKAAMLADNVSELPGYEGELKFLRNMGKKVQDLLKKVKNDPKSYDFLSPEHFETLQKLTMYQIGSMVVKSEKTYLLTDAKEQMRERKVGDKDDIILINACGIRGVNQTQTPKKYNKAIMTETFKTSLKAAKSGFVVFPAVGMGVWQGDPNLYWPAFLDAVVASDQNFEKIFVNPGHRPPKKDPNLDGAEFDTFLKAYKEQYKDDPSALVKLNKIENVYTHKSDVLELAQNLKKAYPEQRVSVFNASDPDVTLGFVVGEYVNHCPHTTTTEENYACKLLSKLCKEGITTKKYEGMPLKDLSPLR